jgi:hypothetical protein
MGVLVPPGESSQLPQPAPLPVEVMVAFKLVVVVVVGEEQAGAPCVHLGLRRLRA